MIAFCLGVSAGTAIMWVYFAHFSGLHRTEGEYRVAKHIGDAVMNKSQTKMADALDECQRNHEARK